MSANRSLHFHGTGADSLRAIRYFAALVSGLTAVIYFLIGFNVVTVVNPGVGQEFGLYAGAAYALGTVVLVLYERRLLWVLGAILQVFVIYTYFSLASQRTPAYEFWGILIRVAQFIILIALAYLALHAPEETELNA